MKANEATLLSNTKPLVLYLGLNYSTGALQPPLRRKYILDSTLPFQQGNSGTAVHSTWEVALGPGTSCAPNDTIHFSRPPSTQIQQFYNLYTSVFVTSLERDPRCWTGKNGHQQGLSLFNTIAVPFGGSRRCSALDCHYLIKAHITPVTVNELHVSTPAIERKLNLVYEVGQMWHVSGQRSIVCN